MTLQQTVTLGNDALAVLESEAYIEAMKRMHSRIDAQLKTASLKDTENLVLIHQLARCADIFQENLYNMMRAGDLAQHKIDLEAARVKPRGRVGQYLRQVSR
jgi:hypothetical protein